MDLSVDQTIAYKGGSIVSVFYVLARLFLFSLHLVIRFIVWRAERHQIKDAVTSAEILAQWKQNANSADSLAAAGMGMRWALADQSHREALDRWVAWQGWSERLASARTGLARWAGASLLYLVSEVGGLTVLNWDFVREVVEQTRYYHGG